MPLVIRGRSSTGLTGEIKEVAEKVAIRKDELEDARKKFVDAETRSPRSLTKLLNSFDVYDKDNNGLLNMEELQVYSKDSGFNPTTDPMGVFSDDKGINLQQLEVLREIAEDNEMNTTHLDELLESFADHDADGNDRLSNEELLSFAEKREIEIPQEDKANPEKQNVLVAVDRYLKATDTTLGIIGGTLLENA